MGAGEFVEDKFARALTTRTADIEFFLPETFMNKSGETARYIIEKCGATPAELVVVYDDVDLPFGEVKVSVGKGHGGHNGIKDIEHALGTRDFVKVRIGVAQKAWWGGEARRPAAAGLAAFVLHEFSFFEKRALPEVYKKVHQALTLISSDGVTKAMNQCNA